MKILLLAFDLFLLLLACLTVFTDWIPSYFLWLFIGISYLIWVIPDLLHWRANPQEKKTKVEIILLVGKVLLIPLSFIAFWVQMHQ